MPWKSRAGLSASLAGAGDAVDPLHLGAGQADFLGGVELGEDEIVVVASDELLDQALAVGEFHGDEAAAGDGPVGIHIEHLAGVVAWLHGFAIDIEGEGVRYADEAGRADDIFLGLALIEIES